jgi:hypothetical protein
MRFAVFCWRGMPIHPDIESLFRYREGECPREHQKAIERHLRACPECRLELRRIGDAWNSGAGSAAPASALDDDPGLLASLLAGIQVLESGTAKGGYTVEGTKRRVAGCLEKYLGALTAGKILQSAADDGSNLLSTVEPVLALFLGRKAAGCLVSRIVEAANVRI